MPPTTAKCSALELAWHTRVHERRFCLRMRPSQVKLGDDVMVTHEYGGAPMRVLEMFEDVAVRAYLLAGVHAQRNPLMRGHDHCCVSRPFIPCKC